MKPISTRKAVLTGLGAALALILVFAGGIAAARFVLPDSAVRAGNPPLSSAAVDFAAAPASGTPAAPNAADMLQAFQDASRAVADNALPVVVRIDVEKNVQVGNPFGSSPFRFFFNGQPAEPEGEQAPDGGQTRKEGGYGSGIVVDQKGDTVYVLTNNHVIEGAEKYVVKTHDGKSFDAKLVGADKNRDLAVISFPSKDKLPVAKLGDSTQVRPGDIVFAVGSPYGIANTVTQGIISAVGRTSSDLPGGGGDTATGFTDYLQTDAAINPGNSGGALMNIRGEVIGINTWIATRTGENVGLGFAVPVNNARKVARDFIDKGKVEYGWLGVRTGNIINESRASLKLSRDQAGAFSFSVIKGSPAEKAGVLPGDLIIQVDGTVIKTADDLIRTISGREVNTEITLKLIRAGKEMSMKVKLGLRDDNADMSSWPGFTVVPMSAELRQQLQAPGTSSRPGAKAKQPEIADGALVVVNVDAESNAAEAGLKQGDVVSSVAGQKIASVADFYQALGKSGKDIQLVIQRNGKDISLSFQR